MAAMELPRSLLLKVTDLGNDTGHSNVVSIALLAALLLVCFLLGHLVEDHRWVNESIVALLLGLGTGVVVLIISKGQSSHILKFNEELFFIYLLPPIIFNAGFSVKKKEFFENFVPIILFGVFGVFVSFAVISGGSWWLFRKLGLDGLSIRDILAIGAIFSATDSVCTLQVLDQDETPLLYSLVFGEGVVNDATSVVLFRAIQTYNFDSFTSLEGFQIGGSFLYLFSLSCILGIVLGLISAYIIKTLYFCRHSTNREIAIMIMIAYLSYLLAELFYLSGILSVFFCGIVMSHYTWHNVTVHSRTTTKHIFATMSFIAESFIFLYVGMDALDIDKWRMIQSSFLESLGLFGSLMTLILLGRAAFVFPLSLVSNAYTSPPRPTIGGKEMIIIWWAGLMRGAVSIALAFNQFTMDGNKSKSIQDASLITTTITVVLASTIVFGTLTPPLIDWFYPSQTSDASGGNASPKAPLLGFRDEDEEDDSMSPLVADVTRFQSLREVFSSPRSAVHAAWRRFDDRYMRPTFGGRGVLFSRYDLEPEPLEDALHEDEGQD